MDDERGSVKHTDALVIADAEGFEWDIDGADPEALYDAIEAIGYFWEEEENCWIGPENPANPYYQPPPQDDESIPWDMDWTEPSPALQDARDACNEFRDAWRDFGSLMSHLCWTLSGIESFGKLHQKIWNTYLDLPMARVGRLLEELVELAGQEEAE